MAAAALWDNSTHGDARCTPLPACGERPDCIERCNPGEGGSPQGRCAWLPLTPTLPVKDGERERTIRRGDQLHLI